MIKRFLNISDRNENEILWSNNKERALWDFINFRQLTHKIMVVLQFYRIVYNKKI